VQQTVFDGEMEAAMSYKQSDVEVLFRRGDWNNWDGPIRWLKEEGQGDNELTGGEVDDMLNDFQRLRDSGKEVPSDPA
jgi:hypothetical protein